MENHGQDVDNATLEQRQCWICLCTEDDAPNTKWLHPCCCRGSTKWVHEDCLSRWVDEIQHGNVNMKVYCTQCRAEYIIIVPPLGPFERFLENLFDNCEHLCPSLFFGLVMSTIYFTSVTYGAVTILQVFGYEEGRAFLLKNYSPRLMMTLPLIPIALVYLKSVNWDDRILHFLRMRELRRRQSRRSTIGQPAVASTSLPTYGPSHERTGRRANRTCYMRNVRDFVSALTLPTCAVMVGRLLFSSIANHFKRTLMGGLTFVFVKGILNIYLRHSRYFHRLDRQVLNYTEQNVHHGRRARSHQQQHNH